MAAILYMPKWGSAMTKGKVVFWSKEEDEEVAAGEIIVEIETEKITNSVEAPVSGILRKILIEAGDSAPVGAAIAVITDLEEEWDGEWQSQDTGSAAKESVAPNTIVTASNSAAIDGAEKKAVTPAARSLAKKRGIDISQLQPTSKSRITVEDVLNYMGQQTGWPGSRFLPVGEWMIHYLDLGKGLPLVLVHGLGASCSAWQPNLFFLADHFRVLAPDLPGAGLSDKPATDYTLEFYVNFMGDFLDNLKIDQCVILGNSLGGEIAAAVAHRFPRKVLGLILEDSAGLGREAAAELKPVVLNSVDKAGIRNLLELLFHDPQYIYPGTIEEMYNLRQQPGAFAALESAVENLLTEGGQKVDISEQLAELRVSALVIWGEQDWITPVQHGTKAVQILANGQLSVYENCGHCPHIEAAERFNNEVKSFIEKLSL